MTAHEPSARELFEVLIRDNGEALMASIRANAGANNADDIFQDTVLVAWRRLADYDRTRPFGPWLRGIARVLAMEYSGRRARLRLADPATLDLIERHVAAFERYSGTSAEPAMSFRERLSALDDCLAQLPAMYAQTVQAVYRETRSLSQIAVLLGENEETVKMRLQRARALLAQCLTRKTAFGNDSGVVA